VAELPHWWETIAAACETESLTTLSEDVGGAGTRILSFEAELPTQVERRAVSEFDVVSHFAFKSS
jgi:hypothetical protein